MTTPPDPSAAAATSEVARYTLAAVVFIVGMLLPIQAGMNSAFRQQAGHALYAGLLNFFVGVAAITVIMLIMRPPPLAWDQATQSPWWAYLGGFIGASVVVVSAIAAPKLGAAFMIACLVAGQLVASIVIDQFGLVRYPVRPINWERIVGALLLIAGLLLIERSARPAITP